MNILGYAHGSANHDTSAAIICDGVLVAAAEEERFSRNKHEEGVPIQAIEFCLKQAGLRMDQVDFIAMPERPFRSGRDSYFAEIDARALKELSSERKVSLRAAAHKMVLDAYTAIGAPFNLNWRIDKKVAAGFAELREHFGALPNLRFFGHHQAHAAAAYYTSGWDAATIVTMDEWGGPYSTVLWHAEGKRIRRLDAELRTNSLGHFYSECTKFLGFDYYQEGKTMGLAAYGVHSRCADQVARLLDLDEPYGYRFLVPPSADLLGFPPRGTGNALAPPYPDFAAAVQSAFECAVQRVARRAIKMAGTGELCLGGGAMLNCSSNGALQKASLAANIWVFPGASDCGLSVGAAALCAAELGELERARLSQAYLGPEFTESECEQELRREKNIAWRRVGNIENEVAEYLAGGETVGWFQGRMEFGPRALGNRSILADPRDPEMHKRVNRIKGREYWRPLGPVVNAERSSEYFELSGPSPFMLFRVNVVPSMRSTIPAVVHVDGSARPQTVTKDQNPRLRKLLTAFDHLTSVPVLLNTSFNAAGEPIVCTPRDAIKAFLAMRLDCLAIGDFVVTRASDA